jgi:hypothetical protein
MLFEYRHVVPFSSAEASDMGSKRTSGAGGSARGKATDLTPKKENSQHGIKHKADTGGPVKAGRNMGGRKLTGERDR